MSHESRVPDYPAVGSRWKEDDKRFERYVIVVAIDPARGERCVAIKPDRYRGDRVTWANPKRFGKSGGYRSAPPQGNEHVRAT